MKQFTAAQPKDASSVFNVSWKPFFLNVESPETSDVPIKVRCPRARNRYSYGGVLPYATSNKLWSPQDHTNDFAIAWKIGNPLIRL